MDLLCYYLNASTHIPASHQLACTWIMQDCPLCLDVQMSAVISVQLQQSLSCDELAYGRKCCTAEGRKISVTDLGSTNGTYLDEEELPPNRAADLYVGSRIVFGALQMAFFLTCLALSGYYLA